MIISVFRARSFLVDWKSFCRLNSVRTLAALIDRFIMWLMGAGNISAPYFTQFHGHCSQEIREIIPVPLRRARTTRSSNHSHPVQVHCLIYELYPHKSSLEHATDGTSCLLVFLNLTTYYLSNLR